MKSKKIAVLWISLVMIFGLMVIIIEIPTPGSGAIIYVDDDFLVENATHKKTIQAGVDVAQPGDTVFVYNGTYFENIFINNTVNLTGEDKENVIIDSNYFGDVLKVTADYVNITGITMINCGSNSNDAGIELEYANNCFINNTNVLSNKRNGISLFFSSYNRIMNNNISSNIIEGIKVSASLNNVISNNDIWNNSRGIYISSQLSLNNVIKNNNISNNGLGILSSSSNNTIDNNTLSNNEKRGILISYSYGNNITNNNFISDGLFIEGNELSYFNSHYIPPNNKVNNNQLFYYKDTNNLDFNGIPVGQLIIVNCSNVNINNLHISKTYVGIEIAFSVNVSITDCNLSSNFPYGVYLAYSSQSNLFNNSICYNHNGVRLTDSTNNSIYKNNLSNNKFGIWIYSSSNNSIIENTILNNSDSGIWTSTSEDNTIASNYISSNLVCGIEFNYNLKNNLITKNNILNNKVGIFFNQAIYSNTITCNNISNNDAGISILLTSDGVIAFNNISSNNNYGLYLSFTSGFIIHHNNIINNSNQSYDIDKNNWDSGYPNGGNYWSDYIGNDFFKGPSQDIPGNDGIGDTNYSFDIDAVDNYPLIAPFTFKPPENTMVLKQGWNLISIPIIQEEENLTRVLGSIDGWYDAVQWHNSNDLSDSWKHYRPDKPFGNDLSHLNETMGFWIHITQPGDTIFLYNGTQPASNQPITLHPGWNMVGYPSLSNRNRTAALNNINYGSDVDAIWTFNATTQTWQEIGPTDYFELGRGYWIHSKVTKVWDVPL